MSSKAENTRIAQEKFGELIQNEYERIERMKEGSEVTDFSKLDKIIIGILPGDGVGSILMEQALRIVNELLGAEIQSGKIELRTIEGMTIENRVAKMESLPEEVLEEVKKCHVLVKGPMVTPRAGDGLPNLVSANSLLRRKLELFVAVRPIKIPDKKIDWTFFRENIEGEYIWGNKGIQVDDDLAVDFKVQTKQGSERIARAAFEFARKNGKKNVTVVTKANIVKLVDGNFVQTVRRVGEEYPEIEVQEKLVDAMCAKMMDPTFTEGMEVIVLPNLYGDIVTDVAAEHAGGLGNACSSNIGNKYALFEAIHGTAPYLMSHGRGPYANPCSLIRAMGQMMIHIGYARKMCEMVLEAEIQEMLHKSPVTHGECLLCTSGERGIRGEAQKGFPVIREVAFPVLKKCLEEGIEEEKAYLQTLLAVIEKLTDTNVLSRSSAEGLRWMQQRASEILKMGGALTKEGFREIEVWNQECIRRNISPGGAADMLAAAIFLVSLQKLPEGEKWYENRF